MKLAVVPPGGGRPPSRRRRRGPLTPIRPLEPQPTFTAPVADPGGHTRLEVWHAESVDGLWTYHRQEGHPGTPWTAVLTPTGQQHGPHDSLDDAREATAGRALDDLRTQAYAAAFLADTDQGLTEGQRWLAIHMRLAGADESTGHCRCGGLLVPVTRDGRLAHVDACPHCHTGGRPGITHPCPHAGDHLFCPRPVRRRGRAR